MMNRIAYYFLFIRLKPCFIYSYILLLFLSSFSLIANAKEKDLTDYNELIDDSTIPITIGLDASIGLSRVRDAIVPNRKDKNKVSYVNAFAFLVSVKDKKNEHKIPDIVMPMIPTLSGVLHIDMLILNRYIWKLFRGYPSLSFDIIYKQFMPQVADILKPNSGQFMGAGISLEVYKEYWADHILYPRISLAIGKFDAPINNKNQQLSHLTSAIAIEKKGKKGKKKKFEGMTLILGLGGGWKYNINNNWSFNLKIISEYMFSFSSTPRKKRWVVNSENEVRKKTPLNNQGIAEKKPDKEYMFLNNILVSGGLSYCINPSKTRYKRYDLPKDSNSLEIGIIGTVKEFNIMSKAENKLLYTPKTTSTKTKDNLTGKYTGFGIFGLYSFKSDWLRQNINSFIFDNLSFIFGTELIYDQAIKNKNKKLGTAIIDSSKLTVLFGLGFNDISLIKPKFLIGYDIISNELWSDDNLLENGVGNIFISPQLEFVFNENVGFSIFSKIRPTKNISAGEGGGGLLKSFNYDLLFYEVGIKIGYIF